MILAASFSTRFSDYMTFGNEAIPLGPVVICANHRGQMGSSVLGWEKEIQYTIYKIL